MQFTFSVDQPASSSGGGGLPVQKPDLKPSPEFTKRTRAAVRAAQADGSAATTPATTATVTTAASSSSAHASSCSF